VLDAVVRWSVRHRGVAIALAAALLVYGVLVVARARYDVFPEFAPPQVSIQTEAPGLTPEQVEVLVTKPIEDAIDGVAGIAAVRSQSIEGLSVITAVFGGGTDIYRARQVVAERLGEVARRLPASARAPAITPLTASTGTVLVAGLTSPTRSLRDQRTFADWTVRPRLLAVPGVARVTVFGGDVRQIQVRPDPVRLRAFGLTIADVVAATGGATGVRGAGVIAGPNQEIRVRTEGQLTTPERLAQSVVRERGGAVLRLGDVARVVEGAEPRVGAASVDGTPGVVFVVDAQLGANVRDVAGAVEGALAELGPAARAERIVVHPALFRPAAFVDVALRNVTLALAAGGVLVAVVLVLFLADVGAAAVSLTAIPLSLLAAIVVLDAFGLTINTLTLGGLAIAIGEVVDDAIIDVENIARRLRENRARRDPRPAADVVLDASLEVRSSVVYATFIVALVFLPVIALTGVQGAMFRPLGLAYVLAILASLVVALAVTPALTLAFLARRRARHAGDPALLHGLKRRYTRRLAALGRHPRTVVGASAGMIAAALLVLPFFGGEFLPEFNEGHLRLHMIAVPGTSLDESLRIGAAAAGALRADPRVRSVAQRAGRAEAGEDAFGPHYSELEVDLVPLSGEAAETLTRDLRARLAEIPGVSFAVMPYLTERIEEVLSGSTAPVVVKLFGDDLDSLDAAASRVAAMVAAVPGTADVQTGTAAVAPEVTVRLRPAAMAEAGIAAGDALAAVETATRGLPAAQVFEGSRATDVVVTLGPEAVARPEDLGRIPLAGAAGRVVPLADVADVFRGSGRYVVAHDGARRVQTVTAGIAGRDVASVARDLESRLRAAAGSGALPRGVYAELGGSAAAQGAARRELLARSGLAAFGIGVLLWLAFGDARRLLLVLANLPFALVGGVVAVALTGASLSLGSLVGFVTLFGITTRNAIMLISHYDHLVREEGAPWGPETAIRGAAERLGPILMTALVTGLGLLPLAIGSGDPGKEIEGPLAIVILGGLVTSTLLSLFVLPTLALRYGRFAAPAVARSVRQRPA
jgi:CzcA family heavy metal efflux pump